MISNFLFKKNIFIYIFEILFDSHFEIPIYPDDIEGFNKFRGQVIHSKDYRL